MAGVKNRLTGRDLYVHWVYSGGTVNLSGNRRSLEISESVDIIDLTAGNDTHKDKAPGVADTTIELTAVAQEWATGTPTGQEVYNATKKGTEGTLVWGPEGTSAGKPKHSVRAIIEERSFSYPYDGEAELNVSFSAQEDITDATW